MNKQMVDFKPLPGEEVTVALAGNPNVGKSTIFNALTGLKQHTGNWPGKTVASASGSYVFNNTDYRLVDIPGTYTLVASSAEEEIARDFICFGGQTVTVVVVDATSLERGINLVLQVKKITTNVIVCVNLLDEAKRKGIKINLRELANLLDAEVVGTSAGRGKGLDRLMVVIDNMASKYGPPEICEACYSYNSFDQDFLLQVGQKAEVIYKAVVKLNKVNYNNFDRKLDRILTSKITGIPIMILLLLGILWITIVGANYPSQILSGFFNWIEGYLTAIFEYLNSPWWLHGVLVLGLYRTLAWVIAVMLPPMAIFFPLFALLEDFGYLPRVAFNLDNSFRKCGAHGKQALTTCMGFGCNACGVVGCRIIDSPRERLIAIITNNFVPCNGRFPTLIAIISMFFAGLVAAPYQGLVSAILLLAVLLLGISMTFLVSRLLSKTLLKGLPSSFVLELPPYRKPQFGKVIVRSALDRVLFVLMRAVTIAAIAGVIIWILANIEVGGTSLLKYASDFLDPFAKSIGLDGVILLAFILGFPANEIVLPIIIMSYLSMGSMVEMGNLAELQSLLVSNGWTWLTAVCTMLFVLMHFPCGTTCWTIKKETKSWRWTMVAFLVPTLMGILICFVVATMARLFGIA